MDLIICKICKEEKAPEDFPMVRGGRRAIKCDICLRRMQKYNAKRNEKYQQNKEVIVKELNERYQEDPDFRERRKISSAKYRDAHKEDIEFKEKRKQYYQEHKEELLEYLANWRDKNREYLHQQTKLYRINNREHLNVLKHNYRARRRNAEGRFSDEDIQALLIKQENKCLFCDKYLSSYTIDHILPLNRGGTNWPYNICLTCESCNFGRQDKLLFDEWVPPLFRK